MTTRDPPPPTLEHQPSSPSIPVAGLRGTPEEPPVTVRRLTGSTLSVLPEGKSVSEDKSVQADATAVDSGHPVPPVHTVTASETVQLGTTISEHLPGTDMSDAEKEKILVRLSKIVH
jgi:hypothetical protein